VVEIRSHHARGYSATPAAKEDQGLTGGRTKGRACGLQFHEEEGATLDSARNPQLPVHGQRRLISDARFKVEDDVIIERLGKIFKDMP
jgi:hypothetical protein